MGGDEPFGISSWTAGARPISDLAPRTGAAIAPIPRLASYSIEHIAEDGPVVFAHACRLVRRASFQRSFPPGLTRPAVYETSAGQT